MFRRCIRIFAVVVMVTQLSGFSLGLHNGMVVCIDDLGHVSLEAAHAEHAHRHVDGEHHEHEDAGISRDREVFDDPIESCFDLSIGQVRLPTARVSEVALGVPTAAIPSITTTDLTVAEGLVRQGVPCLKGGTAFSELACLSGIVLLV